MQRQDQRDDRRAGDRKAGLAEARRRSRAPTVVSAAIGVVASGSLAKARPVSITDRQRPLRIPATSAPAANDLAELPEQAPRARDARPSRVKVRTPATRVPASGRAGRSRARCRSATRKRAPSRRTAPASTSRRSRRPYALDRQSDVAFEHLLDELRALARRPQLGGMRDAVAYRPAVGLVAARDRAAGCRRTRSASHRR